MAELKARELELEAKSGRALKQANNEPELLGNSAIMIMGNSVESTHEHNRSPLRHEKGTLSACEPKEHAEQRRT